MNAAPLLLDDDALPLWRLWLDPRGRIDRRTFWLYGVAAMLGIGLLTRALLDIAALGGTLVEHLANLAVAWPAVAISAKRWHDRDRSAWWVLVALLPVVGWLWALLDNGFVRGTPGPNRFGPPPPAVHDALADPQKR